MEESDSTNRLYGLFLQESLTLSDRQTPDMGGSIDYWANISSDTNEILAYNYSSGSY